MKKLILYLALILLNTNCSPDEPSCDGGTFVGLVFLKSQEDVVEFGTNCYTKIEGNLIIGERFNETTIFDLKPLENLKEILDGTLIIWQSKLTNLKGLENLSRVDGLKINSHNLMTLDGLENLTQIGDLIVTDGFRGFTESLSISNSTSLISIEALHNLTAAEGVYLSGLSRLKSLNGLENLVNIPTRPNLYLNVSITAESCIGKIGCSINRINNFCALQNLFINGEYDLNRVHLKTLQSEIEVQDIIDGNCIFD